MNSIGTFYASPHQHRADSTPLPGRSQDSPRVTPDSRARIIRQWSVGSTVVRALTNGEVRCQNDDMLTALDLTEPYMSRTIADVQGQTIGRKPPGGRATRCRCAPSMPDRGLRTTPGTGGRVQDTLDSSGQLGGRPKTRYTSVSVVRPTWSMGCAGRVRPPMGVWSCGR
jgi:hypothetical protein